MFTNLFRPTETKSGSVVLGCFSPPVILLTFTIEAILAIYTWWRYRATRFGQRSAVFLALLSLFQISEWFICQGDPAIFWSRVGFVATAFLPIIGIDFILMLTKKKMHIERGYVLAAIFSAFFIFLPQAFTAAACTGKFVAFNGGSPVLDVLYAVYYIATLTLGIMLILRGLLTKTANRKALTWLLVGYLAFTMPTLTLYILVITSQSGVGSILCGFAVLLALIHVIKVLPAVEKK